MYMRIQGNTPIRRWIYIYIFFLKLITYMEDPYGGQWYAAGNPDGFRFAAVNRRSPPRAIYKYIEK